MLCPANLLKLLLKERQVSAAGSRNVEWFFAEPEAARQAKRIFDGSDELKKIHIRIVAPEV